MHKWYSSEILSFNKPILTREQFVEKHLPQYAKEYRPDYRIRTYVHKKTGRLMIPKTTPGSIQAQVTKRNNRIDAEYAEYLAMKKTQMEIDRQATEPLLGL